MRIANDTHLKGILQKRHGGFVNTVFGEDDLAYLRGLADAEVPGAQELIDAIHQHGKIDVEER
jgi:hypothetical protein